MTREKLHGLIIVGGIAVLLAVVAIVVMFVRTSSSPHKPRTATYYAGVAISNYIDNQFKQTNSSIRISKVEECITNPRDRTNSQYACLLKINNGVCGLVQFTFTNDSDHPRIVVQHAQQVDPRTCK